PYRERPRRQLTRSFRVRERGLRLVSLRTDFDWLLPYLATKSINGIGSKCCHEDCSNQQRLYLCSTEDVWRNGADRLLSLPGAYLSRASCGAFRFGRLKS